MDKTQLVTTEEKEYDKKISIGVFGLFIVTTSIAIAYLTLNNTTFALITGLIVFIATCFIKFFRTGYLALFFHTIFIFIAASSFGLILWAFMKYIS